MVRYVLSKKDDGTLKEISCDDMAVRFNDSLGPKFYIKSKINTEYIQLKRRDNLFEGYSHNLRFSMHFTDGNEYGMLHAKIENIGESEFDSESVGIKLGIDTDMNKYPDWNDKFFPTMLRCEKTHFYGYFMTPKGKILALVSKKPVASYSYDYNKHENSFGHRIFTVNLDFMVNWTMPDRYPEIPCRLRPGEKTERNFYMIPADNLNECFKSIKKICKIPFVEAKKYTIEKNERVEIKTISDTPYIEDVIAPDGSVRKNGSKADMYGIYKVKVKTEDGYKLQSNIYCRRPYEWYMKKARIETISKPPHASTHTESWYGLFSGYLAGKHYPDEELDNKIEEMFSEIMPLMYDFEKAEALVIPDRIQNIAMLISLLVDRYEFDPVKNENSIMYAIRFAEVLIKTQKSDGAYYRGNTHYTCVIYIAKSLLELWYAEKDNPKLHNYAVRHYESVTKAINNLVEKLDNIETEGEKTFEDGMISCASLQIGMYALTLPIDERTPYIKAAEYMIKFHECLENKMVPDCRTRGCSLRFWEAQYDVQIKSNMFSSPHGWTAWTIYAKYYLYLLTGKVDYLIEMMDAIGACIQLMNDDGNLRWAFVTDPHILADVFVPDMSRPEQDGYKSVKCDTNVYRGKYEKQNIGEQYIDMISGWYRTGKQRVTGGFNFCPLILSDRTVNVDSQGGTCDNDVHEIFKCLEETVLEKAFVAETNNGIISYNCKTEINGNKLEITTSSVKFLHLNFINSYNIILNKEYSVSIPKGLKMIKL